MPQRLFNRKWLFYLLVLQIGSLWSTARSVTVRTPPSNPSTVEAQAKFFQYRHLPTSEDFDQGHRLGSDRHFTERHERSRPSEGLFSAKVRWGDKKGGYGEHYWDLNHAGHAGNHGNDGYDGDDGSYHEPSSSDPYEDHHNENSNYSNDEYDPEKSNYEESSRAKRAHPKVKIETKPQRTDRDTYEEVPKSQKKTHRNKERLVDKTTPRVEEYPEEEEEEGIYEKSTPKRQQYRKQEESAATKEKNQLVLVVSHKDDTEKQPSQYSAKKAELPQYVPYEGGAGVRQHQPEMSVTKSTPRLFLEPSTGHVVDRATGQAYILQPITVNNYN